MGVESLGVITFDTGFMFDDTEVGGLSGITYDAEREGYYAISDDRGETNPARYYEVAIDIGDDVLEEGDVAFLAMTTLLDQSGSPFASRSLDPEGIALSPEGTLYVSSEGDADATPPINPFVNQFNLAGEQTGALPVPDKFLPDGEETFGVRDNLAFESLTVTPDQQFLYTASESALAQDGPVSDLDQESRSRILRYELSSSPLVEEFGYITGAIPAAPDPLDAFSDNGLVELAALDNEGTLLALERSFAVGVGNTIRLYEVLTQEATDLSSTDDLFDEDTGVPVDYNPVEKRLLADFAELGLTPDNVEGMTLGPRLSDGRQTLILVSDNNFNPEQVTQFIALALDLETSSGETGAILDPGLNNDSGFLTGGPAFITLDAGVPEGSMVKAIINSGESLDGFVFEGIPDGIGLAPGRDSNTVDVFVAHEQTSVPFRGEADFQDATVSRLTLSTEPGPMMGAVVNADVAIAAEHGYVRFCSAFMAGPDEGFPGYIFFTGEESSDLVDVPAGAVYGPDPSLSPQRQAGYVVALDVENGDSRPIVGLGRYNHENTIVVPGNWEDQVALLSTDDTFDAPSSQLYLYLAETEGQVWEEQGNLWAFRVTGAKGIPVDPADPFNGVNDYLDIQTGDVFQGEFIPVPDDIADGTTEGVPHDALEEWSNANNVFQFIRLEDLTYDANNPRVVYVADTGATGIEADSDTGRLKRGPVDTSAADNGRIFRFEFNQDDPTMVDRFSVFADGDGPDAVGFRNPDNVDTSSNSLMVQEDRSDARIWRYDFDASTWSVVAAVNDAGGESTGIVDASKWFGDGAWLLNVQAHSTNESEQMKDEVLLKREDGQLLLMKIPGS